ncbi:MAG: hypothetical protein WBM99_00820 [Psychromonas sp.]
MNAYILRPKADGKNRESEFIGGRISIGWSCGESLAGKNREEISIILAKKYSDLSEISVSMVGLFVKMPIGSIVLTPSLQDKSLIHLLRTTSTYKYDPSADNNEKGNPHFIDAEYLKTVPRSSLPKAVVRSLSGARKALSRISQHFDLLDDFISSGFESESETLADPTGNRAEAVNVLYDLLSSDNENVRLQAAIAIVGME